MTSPPRRTIAAAALAIAIATAAAGLALAGPASAADGTITNRASGKCIGGSGGSTANGAPVDLYGCNGSGTQQWSLNSDGTIKIAGTNKCLDVKDGGTADGTPVQLWDCAAGSPNQQWYFTSAFDIVNPQADKCLDLTGGYTADFTRVDLYTCNGSAAQKWAAPAGLPSSGGTTTPPPPPAGTPDLGPNVYVFDPSTPASTIQNAANSIFSKQERNQFGNERYAMLFKPGSYNVNVNVGFYTQVLGLGQSPDNVTINGTVHAEADWFQGNATQNFWRSAENLSVTPPTGSDRWAVSQAAPYRRMHLRGNLALDDGGWSSGGFIADSKIDGQINSGGQQQWFTRDSQIGSWASSNWNIVFAGVNGAPATHFPDNPKYTTVPTTGVTREKPFLYVDQAGAWKVFVPGLRTNATGASWTSGSTAGTSIGIDQFFIAKPNNTAADINAALAAGKNLLFTPGIYHLTDTIKVNNPDTVVLGLGLATLQADNGVTAMSVADVDGVKIAGLLIEAGTTNSPLLMQVGPTGSSASHATDPTSLHDVFFRIGGPIAGKATKSLEINSSDVIGDHMWLWRADHNDDSHPGTVGWTVNTADNGLIVNGANVTMYGLFVEHYQKYQVIWNGNGGHTYFFQNELPYDPPNQSAWMNGGTQGYAAYKVANTVTQHEAWGLGSYAYFNANPSVVEAHSFEVPDSPNVKFHSLIIESLGGVGTIAHIINNTGDPAQPGHTESPLAYYAGSSGTGSTGTITNRASSKCIGASGGNTANGTAVDLYGCVGSPTQQWTVSSDGTIRTGGKCLDVTGGGTADGTPIQLWDCVAGSPNQKWYFTPAFDIVNPQANKCLDLVGGSTADLTKVQLYTCNGSAAQKWAAPSGLPSGA